MDASTLDKGYLHTGRGIASCRVFLSVAAILAVYIDPTQPVLTRWLPLTGGAFVVNPFAAAVLGSHVAYSLLFTILQDGESHNSQLIVNFSVVLDVLFAVAIALVTEGVTSPFFAFFSFAVLAIGLQRGMRAALWTTAICVALYAFLLLAAADPVGTAMDANYLMRAVYIGITGYLVGHFGQWRIDLEVRQRVLEANEQRREIARSLHDGYMQALAGVHMRLESCQELLRREQPGDAMRELTELQAGVSREYNELRLYLRSLADLNIAPQAGLLDDAVPVAVQAIFAGSVLLVEQIFLIMLEGLRNIRHHAHAKSALISASVTDSGELAISICDDGVGFAEGAPPPWSIASRVAEYGGRLTLKKGEQSGAHLEIRLPEV